MGKVPLATAGVRAAQLKR